MFFSYFYLRRRLVEGHHAARDGHVHGDLGAHPADHQHLLPSVGVERGVVDVLGAPQLVLRQLHVLAISRRAGSNTYSDVTKFHGKIPQTVDHKIVW